MNDMPLDGPIHSHVTETHWAYFSEVLMSCSVRSVADTHPRITHGVANHNHPPSSGALRSHHVLLCFHLQCLHREALQQRSRIASCIGSGASTGAWRCVWVAQLLVSGPGTLLDVYGEYSLYELTAQRNDCSRASTCHNLRLIDHEQLELV